MAANTPTAGSSEPPPRGRDPLGTLPVRFGFVKFWAPFVLILAGGTGASLYLASRVVALFPPSKAPGLPAAKTDRGPGPKRASSPDVFSSQETSSSWRRAARRHGAAPFLPSLAAKQTGTIRSVSVVRRRGLWCLPPAISRVETTDGTFFAEGYVSLFTGQPVELRRKRRSAPYTRLCEACHDLCSPTGSNRGPLE